MKKIIVLLTMLLSITAFSKWEPRKFTTDNKDNSNKMVNEWFCGFIPIRKQNNKLYIIFNDGDEGPEAFELKKYKNNTYVSSNDWIVGYDTKLKTVVRVDKDFNVIHIFDTDCSPETAS